MGWISSDFFASYIWDIGGIWRILKLNETKRICYEDKGVEISDSSENKTGGVKIVDSSNNKTRGVNIVDSSKNKTQGVQIVDSTENETRGVKIADSSGNGTKVFDNFDIG